jgi:hypothetical protein
MVNQKKIEILSKINMYCEWDGIPPLSISDMEMVVEKYPTITLYCWEMFKGDEPTPILSWLYYNVFIDGNAPVNAMVIRNFIKKHLDISK